MIYFETQKMTHPIFQRYPLESEPVQTSTGPQPTPYHIYDGHAVLIGGTADLDAVSRLLQKEHVHLVRTESGRALMALWAVDEPEASHGAHTECQVSFYVSHQPLTPVSDSPFALLKLLVTEPHARQMCHGLWNNTAEVVAYNREILGLSPVLARSEFSQDEDRVRFKFYDDETGAAIAEGSVRQMTRPPLNSVVALFRSFGIRDALRAAATKTVEMYVVNPVSHILAYNADAQTISAPEAIVAQLYDAEHDHVVIHQAVYGALDFRPDFVEHMRGFRMVYCNPQRVP